MKRDERHHLKQNELKHLADQAREKFESQRRPIGMILGVVLGIGAIGVAYFAWHEHVEGRAHAMLADGLATSEASLATPGLPVAPGAFANEQARAQAAVTKFKAAADAYPSSDAGIFARYQEGMLWMILGNPSQAATAYQDVIQRDGDRIYGQMARLGLAEAQVRSGQFEPAINTFRELAQRKDGPLPVDGILMQLGRAYLESGKPTDAEQTFSRLVDEYPDSPFNADAKRELDSLKKT